MKNVFSLDGVGDSKPFWDSYYFDLPIETLFSVFCVIIIGYIVHEPEKNWTVPARFCQLWQLKDFLVSS